MNHKVFVVVFVAVIMFVGYAPGLVTFVNIGRSMAAGSQALAFSGHGGVYGFYGPCIIRHFSYTWCLNIFSNTAPGGLITVSKHVVGGPAKPSDFIMGVYSGCNGGKTTLFPGSEKGTTVSLGPTSCMYSTTESGPFIHDYKNTVSANCSGLLNPGDKKICIVTNTFIPGDHT
jgi:hypothetical protein